MARLRTWLKKKFYPDMPDSATLGEWGAWERKAQKRKVAYFLCERIPRRLAVYKMQWLDFVYWFKYRLQKKHKYHLIDTNLKPNYYQNDTRILHGMFSVLVNYVECEMCSLYQYRFGNNNKTDREAGEEWLKYLILHNEEPMTSEMREIYDLYLWWKDEYPKRQDPGDILIEGKLHEEFDFFRERSDEEAAEDSIRFERYEALRKEQMDENTQQLIRLIKIRHALWT